MIVDIIIKGSKCASDLKYKNIYKVNGIKIIIGKDKNRFYDTNTTFFRACCPIETKHKAEVLEDGSINIL